MPGVGEGTGFKILPTSESSKGWGQWRHRQGTNVKDKMAIFKLFGNFYLKKKILLESRSRVSCMPDMCLSFSIYKILSLKVFLF